MLELYLISWMSKIYLFVKDYTSWLKKKKVMLLRISPPNNSQLSPLITVWELSVWPLPTHFIIQTFGVEGPRI